MQGDRSKTRRVIAGLVPAISIRMAQCPIIGMAGTSPAMTKWGMQQPAVEKSDKIGSVAWAVFFIWAGIAILANLPWGWFLLGVGILILASQLVRLLMDMKIEGFWVACGAVFLAGGMWTLLNLPWPLAPILLILLGVVSLSRAIFGARR